MATGVLGLGSSGSTGLNQELIDSLKAAERVAFVEPIEKDIENITSDIEKFDEVNQAVLAVLDAIRPFDLFVTGGVNAFEEKSASTTGSSVLFDATDVTSLNNGTTVVEVTQIGQKDVFQSIIQTDITSNIEDYKFTINEVAVTSANSDFTSIKDQMVKAGTASYNSDTGDFTVLGTTANGTSDVTVNINDLKITDYKGLIEAFDGSEIIDTFSFKQDAKPVYQSNLVVGYSDLVDSDGGSLVINETEFTIAADTTYTDLLKDINASGDFKAEITSSGRLSISSSDGKTALTFDESGLSNPLVMSNEIKITTNGLSLEDLATKISEVDGVYASMSEVSPGNYRLVMKTDEGSSNALSFTDNTLANDLGLFGPVYTSGTFSSSSDVVTTSSSTFTITIDSTSASFDIKNMTYDDIVNKLNSDFGNKLQAKIVDNSLVIEDKNGETLSFTSNPSVLTFSNTSKTSVLNHLQVAKDMKMTVDGVDFESDSNKIVVDGLTINATTVGTSTITIDDDTSYLTTQVQAFVDAYNTLATLVDENTQADSEMYNKTGLKAIVDTIKQMMFSSYGEPTLGREPKSLFEYGLGFDADLSGKITLDETAFAEALTNDLEGLKQLFIGTAVRDEDLGTNDRGFGTLLKETLDGMFYSKGLVSQFETSLTDRKDTLNTDLEKAEETLNNKYDQLAAQFSAYTAIITQFETAFGGLKMMIDQSVATN